MAAVVSSIPSVLSVASCPLSSSIVGSRSTPAAASSSSSAACSTSSSDCFSSRRDNALFGKGLNLGFVVGVPGARSERGSSARAYAGVAQPSTARPGAKATLYDLLGISKHVTLKEIKTAYREKARQYHPDVNPPSEEQECMRKFVEVQKAYGVLVDPNTRAQYDYTLRYDISTRALQYGISSYGSESFGRGSQWGGPVVATPNAATADSSAVRMPSYGPESGEIRFRCSYEMAC